MAIDTTGITKVLTDYGLLGVKALRDDVDRVSATGKTSDSIRFEISLDASGNISLTFYGRQFFKTLETGRGPRKSSTYGQFDLNLEEYLDARNLPFKTSKSGIKYYKMGNSWVSAKSLAHKINKEGDSTYRKGGRIVYTPTLTKLADELKSAITREFGKFIIRDILKN